ncbi:class I SAM-dependent methyltransferase [Halorubrum sp. SD626R]|jgi:SAM-dependent methyltransferase|uniref:class I SAM-dependent methyltransferase n=1 Tax=Halorubrum sp. SD626R TaxID=1419722 RepID=UPI000AB694D0|nr:class I SAM-dependent methyltransferase [Halorubrum sp. SD626R]TKX80213.1 class I SAM-dependent methyltransferase [Halorubrum sp. SD626R]
MERFRNTGQPDWDWWGRIWPTPGDTLRRLGLAPGDRVAEVGSGNGYFALPAARIADPASAYAVDLDESLLAELEGLADAQGIDNVVPVRADARDLADLLPEPVDLALFANAFHGVDDRAAFVAGVAAALAADGRFVVVNWRDRPREETAIAGEPRGPPTELRVGPEETRRAVEDASDLRLAREVDLPPFHYGLVFER